MQFKQDMYELRTIKKVAELEELLKNSFHCRVCGGIFADKVTQKVCLKCYANNVVIGKNSF